MKRELIFLVLSTLFLLTAVSCGGEVGQTTQVQPAEEAVAEPEYPVSDTGTERFWADPAVLKDCDDGLGITTIHWNVEGVKRIEIRVTSPDGKLFVIEGPKGQTETGNWVRDNTLFYLLDNETREVLEGIRVRVTNEGCTE
ncbi:MAG: hypothetical protein JSU96_06320 [Acidobacteriota bacterium]|nr:MAG: hypothetical protein JSU96_06320 [Acidobacteriota bacterium]